MEHVLDIAHSIHTKYNFLIWIYTECVHIRTAALPTEALLNSPAARRRRSRDAGKEQQNNRHTHRPVPHYPRYADTIESFAITRPCAYLLVLCASSSIHI